MQTDYGNNIFGNPETFNLEKLEKYLQQGAKNVIVSNSNSVQHKAALKRYEKSKIKFNNISKKEKIALRKIGFK